MMLMPPLVAAPMPLLLVTAAPVSQLAIEAAGASFPNRLYQDATFSYNFVTSEATVSYTSTGSGKGKCRIKDWATTCSDGDDIEPKVLDWAGSDSLLKDSEYEAYPDLQMYPTVAGAVVPIYHLPELSEDDGPLALSPEVVARIFRSAITAWDDPEIVALNPELASKLPAANITVCVREDKSGTTEIFKKALASFEDVFAAQIGTSSQAEWTNATVEMRDTNTGVASFVAETAYSLGYSVLDPHSHYDPNSTRTTDRWRPWSLAPLARKIDIGDIR